MIDSISIITDCGGDVGNLGESQDVAGGIAKYSQSLYGAWVPNVVDIFPKTLSEAILLFHIAIRP